MGPGSSRIFKPKFVFILCLSHLGPSDHRHLLFLFKTMPFICKSSLDYLSLIGLPVLVLSLQSLLSCGAFALVTYVCVGGRLAFFLLSKPSFSFLKGDCSHLYTHFTDQIGLSDTVDVPQHILARLWLSKNQILKRQRDYAVSTRWHTGSLSHRESSVLKRFTLSDICSHTASESYIKHK